MNIFVLDDDPTKCVVQYPDKHVVKMITESVQMLSTANRVNGVDIGYRKTHANHPCTIWVRSSLSNYFWVCELVEAMHKEWQYRYNHVHNHKAFDMYLTIPILDIPDHGLTQFVQCMPEEYRSDSAIDAYRRFYIKDKWHIRQYTKRDIPEWFKQV